MEEQYAQNNLYADQVMEVFEAGGIEYGRLDYTVLDGRVIAWEINTNPYFGESIRHSAVESPRRSIAALTEHLMADALLELVRGSGRDQK